MSDLISRKALLDSLEKEQQIYEDNMASPSFWTALSVVRHVPTVEAVQVVHCKECTQWGCGLPMETDAIKCCGVGGYMVGKEGYCVYGQKIEKEGLK